jgi:hypothetical protein
LTKKNTMTQPQRGDFHALTEPAITIDGSHNVAVQLDFLHARIRALEEAAAHKGLSIEVTLKDGHVVIVDTADDPKFVVDPKYQAALDVIYGAILYNAKRACILHQVGVIGGGKLADILRPALHSE